MGEAVVSLVHVTPSMDVAMPTLRAPSASVPVYHILHASAMESALSVGFFGRPSGRYFTTAFETVRESHF